MASLPPGTHLPKFDNTLGGLLLGGLLTMALWGVACIQTFRFFTQKSKDGPWLKTTIAILWLLDTIDSALNVHVVYYYLVSNYLNPTALLLKPPVWSLLIHGATSTTSTFFIRTMFIRRFYTLSGGNISFTALIMALSTTQLVVDLIITVKAFALPSFAEDGVLSSFIFITLSTSLASDLGVSVGLLVVLFRSRGGIRRTNSLIHTLMMYIVNTGLVVSIDAGISILTWGLMPHNFVFFLFYLFLSKLYLNSYLAMLNAREELREKADLVSVIQLSHLSGPEAMFTGSLFNPTEMRQRGELVISVSSEVET